VSEVLFFYFPLCVVVVLCCFFFFFGFVYSGGWGFFFLFLFCLFFLALGCFCISVVLCFLWVFFLALSFFFFSLFFPRCSLIRPLPIHLPPPVPSSSPPCIRSANLDLNRDCFPEVLCYCKTLQTPSSELRTFRIRNLPAPPSSGFAFFFFLGLVVVLCGGWRVIDPRSLNSEVGQIFQQNRVNSEKVFGGFLGACVEFVWCVFSGFFWRGLVCFLLGGLF